ncbi:phage antirepressor KilAC domain-containing protein [Methylorubrum thiocyanatum]|uniref:phage antirepressor KilAC domain-containing protein n=1 Tax=Methylorubrum thiocyanatum TaxID=47958 RepID=UPI00383B18B0
MPTANANRITLPATVATARPVVNMIDGQPMADSRDIAAGFDRTHKAVLVAIRTGISRRPEMLGHKIVPVLSEGGETIAYRLNRDAFSVIVMGFTGERAFQWKLDYVEAFNRMEAELRARKPAVDLNDPTSLRTLLLGYTEKVLALEAQVEEQAQGLAIAHEVIEQTAPKAEAYDHLINDKGTCCLADAARIIGAPQGRFFQWLRDREFVFDKGEDTLPNAKLRKQGYFRVKIVRVSRDRYRDQTRVTRTGLDFLRLRWSVGPAKEIEAEAFAARRQGVLGL